MITEITLRLCGIAHSGCECSGCWDFAVVRTQEAAVLYVHGGESVETLYHLGGESECSLVSE